MKRKEVAQVVAMLAAAYPNANITDTTSSVYERMLADLDFETTERAVARLLGSSRFLPTIAEIRAAATELTIGPVRTGVEAYDELMQAVRAHGRCYGGEPAPEFADPIIARAVGVWGSWNDLCSSPSDDPGGRARFIELYDELAKRGRQDVASGIPLPAPTTERRHALPAPIDSQAQVATRVRPGPADATTGRPDGAALVSRIGSQAPTRAPEVSHRRYTTEELDAAIGGAR